MAMSRLVLFQHLPARLSSPGKNLGRLAEYYASAFAWRLHERRKMAM
jgi:hypothetical protein